MEIVGIVSGTKPKHPRGPGGVKVTAEDGEIVELTTFDPQLIREAAENQGARGTFQYDEKPSKDKTKIYKNLTSMVLDVSQTDAVQSLEVLEGSQIDDRPEPAVGVLVDERSSIVAPSKALQKPSSIALTPLQQLEQGFALAVRRYELLQDFIKKHFVKDIHYADGKMFGGSKDVLLQPGAHMIAHAYGYGLIPEIISGPTEAPRDNNTQYTICVKTTVTNSSGAVVGVAFGAASSLVWSHKQGRYVARAIDPDKTFNSTTKMSVKRSVVAAVRQSTDAASLFVEDIEEGGYGQKDDQTKRERGLFKRS